MGSARINAIRQRLAYKRDPIQLPSGEGEVTLDVALPKRRKIRGLKKPSFDFINRFDLPDTKFQDKDYNILFRDSEIRHEDIDWDDVFQRSNYKALKTQKELEGFGRGWISPQGNFFADYDQGTHWGGIFDHMRDAEKAGLINKETAAMYSGEGEVYDFYNHSGFMRTWGSTGNMNSGANEIMTESNNYPNPKQIKTLQNLIRSNRVSKNKVFTEIFNDPNIPTGGQLGDSDDGYHPIGPTLNDKLKGELKLKDYKPKYHDESGFPITRKQYSRDIGDPDETEAYYGQMPRIKGIKTWDDLLRKHIPMSKDLEAGDASLISTKGEVFSNAGLNLNQLERISAHDDLLAWAMHKQGIGSRKMDNLRQKGNMLKDYLQTSKAARVQINPKYGTKGRYSGENELSLETYNPLIDIPTKRIKT